MPKLYLIIILLLTALFAVITPLAQQLDPDDDPTPLLLAARGGRDGSGLLDISIYDPNTHLEKTIGTLGSSNLISGDAQWSPDGRFVYLLGFPADGVTEDHRLLQVFDLQTGELTTVTTTLDVFLCSLPVHWSPIGRYLGYVENNDSDIHRVFVYDAVTRQVIPITEIESNFGLGWINIDGLPLQWTPDGRGIVGTIFGSPTIQKTWNLQGELLSTRVETSSGADSPAYQINIAPGFRYVAFWLRGQPLLLLDIYRWRWFEPSVPLRDYPFKVRWLPETDDVLLEWSLQSELRLGVFDFQTEQLYDLTPQEGFGGNYDDRWGVSPASERHIYTKELVAEGIRGARLSVWDLLENQWAYREPYVVREVLGWWADDTLLAYNVAYEGQAEAAGLYVVDTRTWETTWLLEAGFDREFYAPGKLWETQSPDGRYRVIRTPPDFDLDSTELLLYLVDTDNLTIQQLPGDYGYGGTQGTSWLRWSPSGRYMVVEGADNNGRFTLLLDTYTGQQFTIPYGVNWGMTFSPDERYLTLNTWPGRDDRQTYLFELETQTLRQLNTGRLIGWQGGEHDSRFVCPEG